MPGLAGGGDALELDGERLVAAANAFSPSGEVAGRAVAVGTVAELEEADLEGRIGILYGDLTAGPLAAKGCTVYNPERDQQIVRLLEEKRPAALITVNPGLQCLTRVIEDWQLPIPSATVSRRGWPDASETPRSAAALEDRDAQRPEPLRQRRRPEGGHPGPSAS